MVIILIRRFVRSDKEKEFLKKYRSQRPTQNPNFINETLTKLNDGVGVPENLRSLSLGGPGCVTYLNVAIWTSWEAFADAFNLNDVLDPEIETAPRQRTVLDVLPDDGSSQDTGARHRRAIARARRRLPPCRARPRAAEHVPGRAMPGA